MFCIKCGKPNDDDATFCEYCGAQIAVPVQPEQAVPAAVPTPPPPIPAAVAAPVYAPVAAPRKRKKAGVIAAIVSAVAVIAAVVVVFFVLNDRSTLTLPEVPTMTVNGEDIPLLLSGCAKEDDGDYRVLFMGKKDKRYFVTSVYLSPSSNKTYSLEGFGYNVGIGFSYFDATNDSSGTMLTNGLAGTFHTAEIKTGRFKQNGPFEISASGYAEDYGVTFEFSVIGSVDPYDYDELMGEQDSIYEEILALF